MRLSGLVTVPSGEGSSTLSGFTRVRGASKGCSLHELLIPPSVTKICEHAFANCSDLRKVEIPTNSNLQTIEKCAFSNSNIEEIYFPKSLNELKKGWCYGIQNLTKITISPSNGQFIFKDDKYLLGKVDRANDEFDILLFARRDIEEISIPSNVTKICENAFLDCSKINNNFQIKIS